MAYPVLTGAILIEANGAALNNAGTDQGTRLDNAVAVKRLQIGRYRYPYVSGQAWRRWWREVLYEDFGWKPSPVTRLAKQAFTQGDPIQYEDDDLFGYMAARRGARRARGAEEPAEGGEGQGTQRRISPVKNSLLVSVQPNTVTSDFGHFSRSLPVDQPDPVPFEHELYTAHLQGTFTISLQDVGRFECGPMRDLPKEVAVSGNATRLQAQDPRDPDVVLLPLAERARRVREAVLALSRLRGGANLTRNNTDVTPVAVVIGFLDGGNAPFQNLFAPSADGRGVTLNLPRFQSVLEDYRDRMLAVDPPLYIGFRLGVLENEDELREMTAQGEISGIKVFVGSPRTAIEAAAQHVEEAMAKGAA